MVDEHVRVRASLQDELSKPTAGLRQNVRELREEMARTAHTADVASTALDREGRAAQTSARKVSTASTMTVAANRRQIESVSVLGSTWSRVGRLAGVGAAALGRAARVAQIGTVVAAGAAVRAIYRIGVEYQTTLNVFQSVSHANVRQMGLVAAKARALGQDLSLPATSAGDAARAMTELAKGGFNVNQAISASLGTLRLSTAANIDAARAAEIQVNALNQYGLAANKAGLVADVLANTANAASGEITDVAGALVYIGPIAHAASIDIASTATAIGVLANQGIMGEKAGTGLRGMLTRLVKPTKQARQGIATLGLELYDAQGRFKGLRTLTDQLHKARGRLNEHDFNQAAGLAFGTQNLSAAVGLSAVSAKTWDKMATAVGRAGGAAQVANARMKGLGGAVAGLKSQAETFAIDLYTKASPAVESFVRLLSRKLPGAGEATLRFLGRTKNRLVDVVNAVKGGNRESIGNTLSMLLLGNTKASGAIQTLLDTLSSLGKILKQDIIPAVKTFGPLVAGAFLLGLQGFAAVMKLIADHSGAVKAVLYLLVPAWAAYKLAIMAVKTEQMLLNTQLAIGELRAKGLWNWLRKRAGLPPVGTVPGVPGSPGSKLPGPSVPVKGSLLKRGATTAFKAARKYALPVTVAVGVEETLRNSAWAHHTVDRQNKQMAHNDITRALASQHINSKADIGTSGSAPWSKSGGKTTFNTKSITDFRADLMGAHGAAALETARLQANLAATDSHLKNVRAVLKELADLHFDWRADFQVNTRVAGNATIAEHNQAMNLSAAAAASETSRLGKLNSYGDTHTPRARGGGWANTLGFASRLNKGVAGSRYMTSGVRSFGLGSPGSDHATGRAIDLVGSGLPGYARAVTASGGFAQFHGSGAGRHLHVAVDGPRGGSSGPTVGAYGDTGSPRARAAAAAAGGLLVAPGGMTFYVTASGDDVEAKVRRAVLAAMRQAAQDAKER